MAKNQNNIPLKGMVALVGFTVWVSNTSFNRIFSIQDASFASESIWRQGEEHWETDPEIKAVYWSACHHYMVTVMDDLEEVQVDNSFYRGSPCCNSRF